MHRFVWAAFKQTALRSGTGEHAPAVSEGEQNGHKSPALTEGITGVKRGPPLSCNLAVCGDSTSHFSAIPLSTHPTLRPHLLLHTQLQPYLRNLSINGELPPPPPPPPFLLMILTTPSTPATHHHHHYHGWTMTRNCFVLLLWWTILTGKKKDWLGIGNYLSDVGHNTNEE